MKKNNLENYIFVCIFLLIIYGGLIKPYVMPKEINYLENRTAEQMPKLVFKDFFNNEYQKKYEVALADQIPMALRMKALEKDINLKTKLFYYRINSNYYNDLGYDVFLAKNYLVYKPYNLEDKKANLDNRINNINSMVASLKNVNVYLYYIERDVDINFQDNKKVGIYEYLEQKVNNKVKKAKFAINNFDDYKENFYKTDHHWNYKGSYKGYKEIINLINKEDPIMPIEEGCVTDKFHGSKNIILGSDSYEETFCFYKYNLPNYKLKINGIDRASFANRNSFYDDTIENPAYWKFNGMDEGLYEFDFNQTNKDNLLIIGESYDNAISDLVASHFNKTFVVDLRYYDNVMKEKFNINSFVSKNKIDDILLIGNANFYILSGFNVKGDY